MLPAIQRAGPRPFAYCFALAIITLCGCAEKIPPVSLLQDTPVLSPDATPTLGVAPFSDARSVEQHEGKRPGLVVLGVWNARKGNYVTGDGALGDHVAEAVTEGIARAMSGGRFGVARVLGRPIGTDPQALLVTCRELHLGWIATGTLHDLYGTLHQNAYLLLIPALYVNAVGWDNEKSDPLGVARFSIDVHECRTGSRVFHRDLAAENRYPNLTLSEAAKSAFEDLLQRLRNETAALPAPSTEVAPPAGLAVP